MSRDYSSRTKSKKGKRSSSKPAAKRKRKAGHGAPAWVWMLSGLCLGVVVAAVLFIATRPTGTPGLSVEIDGTHADQLAQNSKNKKQPPESADKQRDKPRFSFYKMLPNYEVVVPGEQQQGRQQQDGQQEGGQEQSGQQDKQGTDKSHARVANVRTPGEYIVQAGSFSTFTDADKRKAKLAMLGVETRIREGQLQNGKTVYRVRSVKIQDLDKLNTVLKRLHENDIETLVMRRRG